MAGRVAILMGSESDRETMAQAGEILARFGIAHSLHVLSAHRRPEALREFVRQAPEDGVEVFIAGAGGAAALPGMIKSLTALPVIGVPLATSALNGIDALYSMVQMPPGAPVATVAVGAWGARNAAYLAAEILALKYPDVREKYAAFREEQSRGTG